MSVLSLSTSFRVKVSNPAYFDEVVEMARLSHEAGLPFNLEIKDFDPQSIRDATPQILRIAPDSFTLHLQSVLRGDGTKEYVNLSNPLCMDELEREGSALRQAVDILGHERIAVVSFHIGLSALQTRYAGLDEHHVAVSATLEREAIRSQVAASLERAKRLVASMGISHPIAIENLDYHEGGAYEHIWDPAFFNTLLESCGVAALLDISHALITARNKAIDPFAFARGLYAVPGRLVEVHLNSPVEQDGNLWDLHADFRKDPKVTEILQTILAHRIRAGDTHPLILNLEPLSTAASQNPHEITEQVKRLIELATA